MAAIAPSDNNSRPATPPTGPPGSAQQTLLSTPHSRGTSSHANSEGFDDIDQDTVAPWLSHDLTRHQRTDADLFLKFLLRKVVVSAPAGLDGDDLLEGCLTEVRAKVCSQKNVIDPLKAYCAESREEKRYDPFVRAFNHAFNTLRKIKKVGQYTLRPVDDLDVLFCRNDPVTIRASYKDGELQNDLKPDIIIASLQAARTRHDHGATTTWDDMAFSVCPNEPPTLEEVNNTNEFTWRHVLSSLEFKCLSIFRGSFPSSYDSNRLVMEIPAMKDVTASSPAADLQAEPTANQPGKGKRTMPEQGADAGRAPSDDAANKRPRTREATQRGSREAEGRATIRQKAKSSSAARSQKSNPEDKPAHKLKVPPIIQCGAYAANMLGRSPTAAYAINLMIFDAVAYIWWYDRQGAIQSTGINFVHDLPRFVVLLMALQRFSLEDWGFVTELDPEAARIHSPNGRQTGANKCNVVFDRASATVLFHETVDDRYGLRGRGTRVVVATDVKMHDAAIKLPPKLEYVVKLSWVDKSRAPEHELVETLRSSQALRSGLPKILNHLPNIVAHKDYALFDTGHIRSQLEVGPMMHKVTDTDGTVREVEVHETASRILRLELSERLFHLKGLQGAEFLRVFLDIVLCHYLSWTTGAVQHRDPSLANSMYRTIDKTNYGVLNDFDLATGAGSGHDGLERTGTAQFMSIELLKAASKGYQKEHLYRHDLEGYYWVLVWVCNCVDKNGVDKIRPMFAQWEDGNYSSAYLGKLGYEDLDHEEKAGLVLSSQRPLWAFAKVWTEDFNSRLRPQKRQLEWTEETPRQSWGHFVAMLESQLLRRELAKVKEGGEDVLQAIDAFIPKARHYL